MKRMPILPESDPISSLVGLLNILSNAKALPNSDFQKACYELGNCLTYLQNEIEDLKENIAKKKV